MLKNKFSLFIFFYSISNLYCQDSIHFYTNEIIKVKVAEVTIEEVLYYHFDTINGLLYRVGKDKINFIKYENNLIDSFKLPDQKVIVSLSNPESIDLNTLKRKITINGKYLEYKNHDLNDKKFFILINTYSKTEKKAMLLKDYRLMMRYKIIKTITFIGGMALATPLLAMTGLYSLIARPPDYQYVFAGLGSAVIILGTTIPISIINTKKHSKKQQEMVQLFNDL